MLLKLLANNLFTFYITAFVLVAASMVAGKHLGAFVGGCFVLIVVTRLSLKSIAESERRSMPFIASIWISFCLGVCLAVAFPLFKSLFTVG